MSNKKIYFISESKLSRFLKADSGFEGVKLTNIIYSFKGYLGQKANPVIQIINNKKIFIKLSNNSLL